MLEIKVVCNCGQKFKFDVEPVNGLMPFVVNCPICGADGTAAANAILAQTSPAPPPPRTLAPNTARIHLNRESPAPSLAPSVSAPPPLPAATRAPGVKTTGTSKRGLGILGAFLGAGLGVGLMYAFYEFAGFRFPLLGIGIGVLTGYGARILFKGGDNILGIISACLSLVAVVGALYLMYGEFPLMSIISVIVSASIAHQIASR